MPTEQEIREALRPVTDPEIGISVIDLGMIREVVIEGNTVEIKMVLTAPFCPLADFHRPGTAGSGCRAWGERGEGDPTR